MTADSHETVYEMAPTTHWQQLNDRFYCKHPLYSMTWKVNRLSNYLVSAAPYGGPVALMHHDRFPVLVKDTHSSHKTIDIHNAAGVLLQTIESDGGQVIGLGWTDAGNLVCVLDHGTVRIYPLHQSYFQFSLGQDAKISGVMDCRFFGSGLVVLTGNFKLVFVTNFDDPRPKPMCDPGLLDTPHAWDVIPPQYSLSKHPEVILATNSTILLVEAKQAQDQRMEQGPFTAVSVSNNGKLLALFYNRQEDERGVLWVVSSDFQKSLTEFVFPESITSPPNQMVWCGTDSVLAYWPPVLYNVGPFGDSIEYVYEDDDIFLATELDGVRIIGSSASEFLQKVPGATEDVFGIGSTHPAAILYDAVEHFERKSPRADDSIRSIKGDLSLAVNTCIEAAGQSWEPQYARALLKAASFGKSFLKPGTFNSDFFVDMCQTLRILNAVRSPAIGIPLTYSQWVRLTPEALVQRLVQRNLHAFALRVCDHLKLGKESIYAHWARTKIIKSAESDDDVLCAQLVGKLSLSSGISYAEIAQTAYHEGRQKLATKLLDYETEAGYQVPLLISMQEDELALVKAIESVDSDLVYLVLLHLRRKHSLAEFFRLISNKPVACNLLEIYGREQDLELLKDFYYQDDRRADMAKVKIMEGYESTDVTSRIEKFKVAIRLFQEDKSLQFEAKATETQIKLLRFQEQVERELGESFLDLSVAETLHKLIRLGHAARADKFRSDFKVPEKRFWWTSVSAYAEMRGWEALEKLSRTKKSPIGMKPFVDACLKAGAFMEANKYIARCDQRMRPALYLKTNSPQQAAEVAFQLKDWRMLQEIREQKRDDIHLVREVDNMIAQLRGGATPAGRTSDRPAAALAVARRG